MNRRDFAGTGRLAIVTGLLSLAPSSRWPACGRPAAGREGLDAATHSGRSSGSTGILDQRHLHATRTPADLAGKEFFTDEEAVAYLKKRLDQYLAQPKDDIHYDDAVWQGEDYTKEPNRRTSLIIDPRDGPSSSVDARREEARGGPVPRRTGAGPPTVRRAARWPNGASRGAPSDLRCFRRPPQRQSADSSIPGLCGDSPRDDAPTMASIPLDGRPHVGPKSALLAGDSRGHWEGDTLVVDTTNFTDKTNFRGAPRNTRPDIFASDALHVVERLTRVGAGRIRYEFTVDDPATWTNPGRGKYRCEVRRANLRVHLSRGELRPRPPPQRRSRRRESRCRSRAEENPITPTGSEVVHAKEPAAHRGRRIGGADHPRRIRFCRRRRRKRGAALTGRVSSAEEGPMEGVVVTRQEGRLHHLDFGRDRRQGPLQLPGSEARARPLHAEDPRDRLRARWPHGDRRTSRSDGDRGHQVEADEESRRAAHQRRVADEHAGLRSAEEVPALLQQLPFLSAAS